MAILEANKWLAVGAVGAVLGASLVKWEGTEYVAYKDIAGILTVCNGHTGSDIITGRRYTPEQCSYLLAKDVKKHRDGMLSCVKVPLTQYQSDAFTMFTFNVGVSAFCTSTTVAGNLNKGNYSAACDGLLKWIYSKGKPVQGLRNRREYEREMCLGKYEPKTT